MQVIFVPSFNSQSLSWRISVGVILLELSRTFSLPFWAFISTGKIVFSFIRLKNMFIVLKLGWVFFHVIICLGAFPTATNIDLSHFCYCIAL